jgi:hypothetical protein
MFSVRVNTVNLGHNAELLREALIISSFVPPGITGNIWRKSPPSKTVLPPNGRSQLQLSHPERTSRIERSRASKQHLLFIGASSQTIREVISRRLERCMFFLMAHVDNSLTVSGILNLEWVVRPPGNKRDAIPDEATTRTTKP